VVSIGGDFIGYRFLAPPFLVGVYLLVRVFGMRVAERKPLWVALVGVLLTYNLVTVGSPVRVIRDGPVANDVSYWYPRTGLRFFVKPLANVGFVVRQGVFGTRTDGRVVTRVLYGPGGLGPFCIGPRVHYIDRLGITDPLMARLPAAIDRPFLPGHLVKPVPSGYVEAVGESAGKIERKDIAEYYEGLRLITSGGLFEKGRWKAIARYNFGDRIRFKGPYPPAVSAHQPLREQYISSEYAPQRWWQ
jgi:hypothetical protein